LRFFFSSVGAAAFFVAEDEVFLAAVASRNRKASQTQSNGDSREESSRVKDPKERNTLFEAGALPAVD